MCSACAGDDPRPEMFVSFDVSSPKTATGFAAHHRKKRSRYGTRLNCSNRAIALISLGQRAKTWFSRGPAAERATPTVNLCELGFRQVGATVPMGSLVARVPTMQFAGAPIEIRVTRNVIVEVYGEAGPAERVDTQDDGSSSGDGSSPDLRDCPRGVSATSWLTTRDSAWSRDARRESLDAVTRRFNMRRARLALLYAGFLVLAGFAAWYAMR